MNFAAGAGGEDAFRFVGPDGIMGLGRDGITITKRDPDKEPGYTIDTFPKSIQDAYLTEYRKKYPEKKAQLRTGREERFLPPPDYNETEAHTANFVEAVRTRTPVIEDSVFGLARAGLPCCAKSASAKRPCRGNPEIDAAGRDALRLVAGALTGHRDGRSRPLSSHVAALRAPPCLRSVCPRSAVPALE